MIDPPGNVAPPSAGWSNTVSELIDTASKAALEGADLGGRPEPFYNPLEDLPATQATVTWSALSGTFSALDHLPAEQRWKIADETRIEPHKLSPKVELFGQDEYCEWSVTRNGEGKVTRVTFTSEVGEWFEHLAGDPPALAALYSELVGQKVEESELFSGGGYNRRNRWNTRTDGPIAHLAQRSNNLEAAVVLAAEASVVRTKGVGGPIITDATRLMECGNLGNPDRFSDPSIATTINAEAAGGARIALANPPGLYLAGIRTEGMRLPAGHGDLDPADFWHPESGEDGRVVRARFEPPAGTFTLSDILLDGKPIATGAQLAERVDVTISVLVHPADLGPVAKPCG